MKQFVFVLLTVSLLPTAAWAQYKNNSFSLDMAVLKNTRPSIYDADGNVLPVDKRPLRLSDGLRLSIGTQYKMDEDHWWFDARANINFMRYGNSETGDPGEVQFDQDAFDSLGTLFGLQGQLGVRYVFLTDKIRPYLQGSVSYMHIFSFTSQAGNDCTTTGVYCGSGLSNSSAYLPHPNLMGIHLEPGLEVFIMRDIALRAYADLYRWLIINAADNHGMAVGLGATFFL